MKDGNYLVFHTGLLLWKQSSSGFFKKPSKSINKLSRVSCTSDRISARGNQRDRDRERAQARTGGKGKQKDDGLTPEQRRERDAKALQEKAAKKAAQDAGGNNAGFEAEDDVTTLNEGRDVKMCQTPKKRQNAYQTHPYTTKPRI
ncbi:hypothetical protein JHK85_051326 [Glycine max]|nr:hypothetical protein JHK86_050465 [Glycine max]KAG4936407.1 hypothetical protein JHK85_051326 [Glycine max]